MTPIVLYNWLQVRNDSPPVHPLDHTTLDGSLISLSVLIKHVSQLYKTMIQRVDRRAVVPDLERHVHRAKRDSLEREAIRTDCWPLCLDSMQVTSTQISVDC
jgi:hypothetical protein